MTLTALGLVLAAAVLHAAWNLLAKRTGGGAAPSPLGVVRGHSGVAEEECGCP